MTRLLALDVGEARIGVAVSDPGGFLASPYTTLHVSADELRTWTSIQRLVSETEAEGLVIGLPISLDGQIHAQGERIQAFAEHLKPYISIPISFWDERLSTVEAQRLLIEREPDQEQRRRSSPSAKLAERVSIPRGSQRHTHARRPRPRQEIDALAATVLLQDYLDHHRNKIEDTHL